MLPFQRGKQCCHFKGRRSVAISKEEVVLPFKRVKQ